MKLNLFFVSLFASSALASTSAPSSVSTGTPGTAGAVTPETKIIPPAADRIENYPDSSTVEQMQVPTTREVQRQRDQMERQRERMRSRADCSTITDTQARADCEARTR